MQRQRKEGKTLTKQSLAKTLTAVTGSLLDARKLTDDYFKETAAIIVREGGAKIYGLGTFKCRDKKARLGRNPRSGERKDISERRVVTFKASTRLREKVEQFDAEQEG